jgi:predicted alpha/beta superfamily hydrolase
MRILLVLFTLIAFGANSQVTIRVTSLPVSTPSNPTLFVAGSFNGWNPGDSSFMFIKNGPVYEITLPAATGAAQYKITRGSWTGCEGTAGGGQISNRTFTYSPNLVIEIQIAGWEGSSGASSTALPNVHIISSSFFIPQLNKTRRVWIYLPNDYDSAPARRYPVMYMHDGQNVFDASTSFSGEWGVDETLSNKQKNGDQGCIVVAVDNGGASRLDEYSPYRNPAYGGGQGEAYVSFLVNTLKPYIDSAYRTKPEREYTSIAGSSMGGLISLYALVEHPLVFSKAGIFSPAFWFSDSLYAFIAGKPKQADVRIYFVAGLNESQSLVNDMDSMIVLLKSVGYTDAEIVSQVKVDGAHSEWFWKREFGACYDWLYKGTNTGIANRSLEKWKNITVYPNPVKDTFYLSVYADEVKLVSKEGKQLQQWKQVKAGTPLLIKGLNPGNYILYIKNSEGTTDKKLLVE